jgi:uncharacterized protein (DUF427 family)
MRAIWNGHVIAESDQTVVVENNHYFPPDSVRTEFLRESRHRSTCPWKGEAHYYHIVVGGNENKNAAWTYPEPKEAAEHIKNHVAFWKGVEVVE